MMLVRTISAIIGVVALACACAAQTAPPPPSQPVLPYTIAATHMLETPTLFGDAGYGFFPGTTTLSADGSLLVVGTPSDSGALLAAGMDSVGAARTVAAARDAAGEPVGSYTIGMAWAVNDSDSHHNLGKGWGARTARYGDSWILAAAPGGANEHRGNLTLVGMDRSVSPVVLDLQFFRPPANRDRDGEYWTTALASSPATNEFFTFSPIDNVIDVYVMVGPLGAANYVLETSVSLGTPNNEIMVSGCMVGNSTLIVVGAESPYLGANGTDVHVIQRVNGVWIRSSTHRTTRHGSGNTYGVGCGPDYFVHVSGQGLENPMGGSTLVIFEESNGWTGPAAEIQLGTLYSGFHVVPRNGFFFTQNLDVPTYVHAFKRTGAGQWSNVTEHIPAGTVVTKDMIPGTFFETYAAPFMAASATDEGRLAYMSIINSTLSEDYSVLQFVALDVCWDGCSEWREQGVCIGPNLCRCTAGFTGPSCAVEVPSQQVASVPSTAPVAASPGVISAYLVAGSVAALLLVTLYKRSNPGPKSAYHVRARYGKKLVRDHSLLGVFACEAGDPFSRVARMTTLLLSISIMFMTAQLVVVLNEEVLGYGETKDTSEQVMEAVLAAVLSAILAAVFGVSVVQWGMRKPWGVAPDAVPERGPDGLLPPLRPTSASRAFLFAGMAVLLITVAANAVFAMLVTSAVVDSLLAFGSSVAFSLFVVEPLIVFIKHQMWNEDHVWSRYGADKYGASNTVVPLTRANSTTTKGSSLRGGLRDIVVSRAEWESTSRLRVSAPIDLFSRYNAGDVIGVSGLMLPIDKVVSADVVEIAITPTIQSGSALAFCDAPFLVNVETL